MTPLARSSLEWFAENGPIGWFDRASPTAAMRRRLIRLGLVEQLKTRDFGLIRYQITAAGRALLKEPTP